MEAIFKRRSIRKYTSQSVEKELVEELLTGKDLTLGIIGNVPEAYNVLPIVEEDYSQLPEGLPKICGYEAKWLQDSPYFQLLRSIPAKLPEQTEKLIIEPFKLECIGSG